MPSNIERAREARSEYAAARAVDDPARLAQAARIYRAALRRGLVDHDGNVIDRQREARERAAEAI